MRFVRDAEHFSLIVEKGILSARKRIWIATATVKNLHVPGHGSRSRPLLDHLERLQRDGVNIRLLHGGLPSNPFRDTLKKLVELRSGDGFEMLHCPRVHCKMVLVDGIAGYTGSANLTGAGMGARSERKRNFEAGIHTDNREFIGMMEEYFDGIWRGDHCPECRIKDQCPEPVIFP